MSDNPYTSPQVETEQVESDLVQAERSWAVHHVAVVNFALGTLGLICTGMNVFSMIVENLTFNVPGTDVYIHDTHVVSGVFTGMAGWWVFVIFFYSPAILCLPASYGVYHRREWGRCYAVVIAGITGLFGAGFLLRGFDLVRAMHPEEFPMIILGGVMLGYAVWVYVTLLRWKHIAEFE